ncbi:MAG: hypothetical protein AVDCRST_MAG53-1787 [uncultured Solirubrobacteraceae bacterium]|uniref:Uncharacterized protein n=1 Tax=uncultured Solirubrobacteraceae bacterium TaxID=1162706 RepID=A0A6J4SLV1_9ACTN|nr:MAG: hypothetical protein AVDCRST_MAG53-1787 [uncultured Solirubrobacteraceae bacterium]
MFVERRTWPVAPLYWMMMPSPLRLPVRCNWAKSSLASAVMSPMGIIVVPKPPVVVGSGESMRCTW